ncbi:MAG: sulfatase [Planctomycetaceae bacterium]|nr:sulfatase [Planctomycetaceae bacterium]
MNVAQESRRCFRAPLVLALCMLVTNGPTAIAGSPNVHVNQSQDRPCVLVMMADNWAWPHASALGDSVVRTPTFDHLASNGVVFDNAFCLCPSCAPARAAFLTGQTIHRLDDAANLHGRFPAEIEVFPEALEKAGYHVGFSGKGWAPGRIEESGRTRNPAGEKYADAEAFLNALPSDQPFFYWYSSRNPHIPWQDGEQMKAEMNPKDVRVPQYLPDVPLVRDNICDYLCEVQLFDQECAQILEQFERAGRLSNTLVIMTGDNGWQMPHGLAHIYDAGTRVPLVMSWPGKIEEGIRTQDFVNFDDFAPTFMELAGLKPGNQCTGHSLLPAMQQDPHRQVRDYVFLSRERHANVRRGDRSYPVRALRTRDFLFVRNFEPELWPAGDPEVYHSVGDYGDVDFTWTKQFILQHQHEPAIRPFFTMNFSKRPSEELYDLRIDPDQTINVIDQPDLSDVRRQLSGRLEEWMNQTADPRSRNPHDNRWDKAPYYGGKANNNQIPKKRPRD